MPEVKMKGPLFRVEIMEYERGWAKLDEVKFFDSMEDAEAFCKDYNKDNTASVVPDWYMTARYVGRIA